MEGLIVPGIFGALLAIGGLSCSPWTRATAVESSATNQSNGFAAAIASSRVVTVPSICCS